MARRTRRRRSYDPIEWAAAIALAAGSIAAYVVWNTTFLWWVAPLGTLPFLFMLQERARKRGSKRDEAEHFQSSDGGPWTPPDGV